MAEGAVVSWRAIMNLAHRGRKAPAPFAHGLQS
jgi:hypothetical protein